MNPKEGRNDGEKTQMPQTTNSSDMKTSTLLSPTTALNANGMNTPIKRQRLSDWTRTLYAVYKKPISHIKTQVKVER